MDPAAAVSPETFDALTLFLRADWVVKLVMIGLAAASLWSWTVILDKLFRFAALNREANRFEDAVASGRSLEEIAAEAGERPRHALPRMLQGALKEWRDARQKGQTDSQAAFLVQRIDRVLDTIIARESQRKAIRAGVKIAFGTDAAVFPHGDNGKEFAALVDKGLTPLQAIQAATISAMDLLGLKDRGVIEAGRLADIIAVPGNPLENVRVLEDVRFVMKGGLVYKKP